MSSTRPAVACVTWRGGNSLWWWRRMHGPLIAIDIGLGADPAAGINNPSSCWWRENRRRTDGLNEWRPGAVSGQEPFYRLYTSLATTDVLMACSADRWQWLELDLCPFVVFKSVSFLIGLSIVLRPHQHSIGYMGDGFYRSKDPTNSIKVLKEHIQRKNQTTQTTKYTIYAYAIMDKKI